MADISADFELLKSILTDLDRHLFGRGLATENIEIAQNLLESPDVGQMLHPDFVKRMQERIDTLGVSMMKRAQGDVSRLTQLRQKYGNK
jgi:hypothetical protein